MSEVTPISIASQQHSNQLTKFLQAQKYMFGYAAGISIVSPALSAYQLCRLYGAPLPPSLMRTSLAIFPHQTVLKMAQMNACTPVKEYLNPWAAFYLVGVLQGGVYGQANVHFAKTFSLGKKPNLRGLFRGALFAGCRDSISQGVPFMFSSLFKTRVLDQLWTAEDDVSNTSKTLLAVGATSLFATVMSQGLHNCQVQMQADQTLSYVGTLSAVAKRGPSIMWRGAEARVCLLLLVNVLNELVLKRVWDDEEAS